MSFIQNSTGTGYAPGWFLAEAECSRETRTIPANHAQVKTAANGGKYVPMGAIFPSNDANAIGIVYEDVDVTTGAMTGSVVTNGVIYADRLPALESSAKSALQSAGFVVIDTVPAVVRPVFDRTSLETITVASAAGTASGDTKLTLSGYTPGAGESYKYKVATGTAPAVALYEVLDSTWTEWNGTSDITAATGKKITVASVDSTGAAVAAGDATVTAKA